MLAECGSRTCGESHVVTSPWLLSNWICALRWATWPATILWGASFPWRSRESAGWDRIPDDGWDGIYAANTLGRLSGAIGCSMVLIPCLGTQHVPADSAGISGLAAMIAFCILFLAPNHPGQLRPDDFVLRRECSDWTSLLAVAEYGSAAISHPRSSWRSDRVWPLPATKSSVAPLSTWRGHECVGAVTELSSGVRNSTSAARLKRPPNRRTCDCSACWDSCRPCCTQTAVGAGRRLWRRRNGRLVPCASDVERIIICEIEPLIPQVVARYFGKENYDVVRDHASGSPMTTPETTL